MIDEPETPESKLETEVKDAKPAFDPDLPPSNIQNREAARAHGLRYDRRRNVYVDEDGFPARDRFGQYLG
ncbi:hypothetical protein HY493_02050 [Candidatus Woesearchaeota archaeon]|nr:hypothetical protein [Candidatus Woesearchaeota archaeon]